MGKILLDPEVQAKLNGLDSQLELCDASGKTLGRFLPEKMYRDLMQAWGARQFTSEEIQVALQQTGGRPLADIWKDLGRS